VRAHTEQALTEQVEKEKTGNGARKVKLPRRRNPASPPLSEKAKKLALKAFQMTYEAHHGKSS